MHSISGMLWTALLACALAQGAGAAAPQGEAQPYAWRNVAIGGGGFVSGIIAHPAQRGLMYARTDIGGAYRWDDSARRWIPVTDWVSGPEWNYSGIESLAVDPGDADRVYIAAGTYTNDWTPLNGAIFRSDDRGRTWHKTELPFKNGGNEEGRNAGERLMVDPNHADVIYFGSRHHGLWKSTDRGATWKQVESFPVKERTNGVGLTFVAFDKLTGKPGAQTPAIYVGVSTTDGPTLYRSTDAGETWHSLPGQPGNGRFLPNHGVVGPDGALYITYADAPGPNGMTDGAVWRFNPDGDRWNDISPIKPSKQDSFGYCGVSLDAQRPDTLVVSTMDRWARKDTIFRSTDGGQTWVSLLDPGKATYDHSNAPYTRKLTPHWIGDVEIDPFDSDHVMFVTGYGIWGSRDGGSSWTFDTDGLEETVINEVISPPGESGAQLLCVMWDLGGFRHEKLDESPAQGSFDPPHGRNTSIDFAELNPDIVARVFQTGENSTGGAFSADNGRTWTMFPSRPSERGDGAIAVSADGKTFVWATEEGPVVYSTDQCSTWNISEGLQAKVRVVSDRASAGDFYALDSSGGKLYTSTDGGANFSLKAENLPVNAGQLRAAPGRRGDLWLATWDGLYRSTDAGATFTKLSGIDSGSRIGFGRAAPGREFPAVYVVGVRNGVYGFYRSDDEGGNWVRINDDQHQFANIQSITGDPRVYGRVYLGSSSRGVLYGEPVRPAGAQEAER